MMASIDYALRAPDIDDIVDSDILAALAPDELGADDDAAEHAAGMHDGYVVADCAQCSAAHAPFLAPAWVRRANAGMLPVRVSAR